MKAFRAFLVVAFVAELVYTIIAGNNQGWNIFPIIIDSIVSLTWVGQFNLDFTFFLALTGLWVAWRNKFSSLGIILGLVAFVGGIVFLSVYLFFLSFNSNDSVKEILIGNNK